MLKWDKPGTRSGSFCEAEGAAGWYTVYQVPFFGRSCRGNKITSIGIDYLLKFIDKENRVIVDIGVFKMSTEATEYAELHDKNSESAV